MGNDTDNYDLLKGVNDQIFRENIVVVVYMSVVIVFGIFGNTLSFVFHTFVEKRKSVTSLLISALAVNDSCACFLMIGQYFRIMFFLLFTSDIGCKIFRYLNYVFLNGSMLLLNPIGIERCLKVVCKNQRFHLTRDKARVFVFSVLLYSIILGCRHFLASGVVDIDVEVMPNQTVVGHVCTYTNQTIPLMKVLSSLDVLNIAVTNVLLISVYAVMAKKIGLVQKHVDVQPMDSNDESRRLATTVSSRVLTATNSNSGNSDGDQRQRTHVSTIPRRVSSNYYERKITIMLGVITMSSLLSFVPYFIVQMGVKPDGRPGVYYYNPLVQIAWRSVMLNSAINPYIIIVFNNTFRRFIYNVARFKFNSQP